jgi:DNA polymerase III subunit alpha
MIVEARGTTPFASLFDLARRCDLKRIGKRPLEMLARAGAFDPLEPNRARVFEALDALVAWSAAVIEAKTSSQVSLFGEAGTDLPEPRLPFRDDWLAMERLAQEHQAIGFYLSGHPLDDYMPALRRRDVRTLTEITEAARSGPLIGKIAGTVSARQERKSARGNRFAFVALSDPSGLYEVTVFSEVLEASRAYLEPGLKVVLTVKAELEGETLKLLANGVQPIDAVADQAAAVGLRVHLDRAEAAQSIATLLARLDGRQKAPITLCLPGEEGEEIDVLLPGAYPVSAQIKGAIKSIQGVVMVEEDLDLVTGA